MTKTSFSGHGYLFTRETERRYKAKTEDL